MELKNIYNRNEFKKIYEFFGGAEGGVGAKDGFANNAALKDTVLGKLLNGIFKGVAWLWRKTKENFIIHRLIAQLVNELMRGIILFCFANNISLSEGEKLESTPDINIEGTDNIEDDSKNVEVEEIKKLSEDELEELRKKIKEYQEYLGQVERNKLNINNQMSALETKLKTLKNKNDIDNVNKKINNFKKNLESLEGEKNEYVKRINEYRNILDKYKVDNVSVNDISKVNTIEKLGEECHKKYRFNPKSDALPEDPSDFDDLSDAGMTYPEFKENLKGRFFKYKKIKIGDDFRVIETDGNILNIKVYDINNSTGQVWYFTKDQKIGDKPKETTSVKLLPKDFPKFNKIKSDCYKFLNRYILEYDNMTDVDKQKMETIYMQYKLIDKMSNIKRSALKEKTIHENATYEYFNQIEFLYYYIQKNNLLLEDIKVKQPTPKAGKVGLGRTIATKAGASVTVGDILNKRDKEKYKNRESDFNLGIRKVNLAEIEKQVEKMNAKKQVSSFVNPYNLKTIQLTAEQLFQSGKEGKANNIKLKWEKDVSNTYASFTNIMDVESIDISKSSYGSNLDTGKLNVDGMTSNLKAQDVDGKVMNLLSLKTKKSLKFSDLSHGYWSYFSFSFPKSKGELYNTTIAPVSSVFPNYGLLCITSCFNLNKDSKLENNNDEFKNVFTYGSSDEISGYSGKINVYFLIRKNQKFPDTTDTISTNVFVINEYFYNNKNHVSLRNVKGHRNMSINDNSIKNINKNDYMFNIGSRSLYEFNNLDDKLKTAFNFVKSSDPKTNTEFAIGGTQPAFLTDNNVKKLLETLSEML